MPILDMSRSVVSKSRKKRRRGENAIVVDLGSTTKTRLEEVARIGETTTDQIVERLVDWFLCLDAEKQKAYITKSKGVVVL